MKTSVSWYFHRQLEASAVIWLLSNPHKGKNPMEEGSSIYKSEEDKMLDSKQRALFCNDKAKIIGG